MQSASRDLFIIFSGSNFNHLEHPCVFSKGVCYRIYTSFKITTMNMWMTREKCLCSAVRPTEGYTFLGVKLTSFVTASV